MLTHLIIITLLFKLITVDKTKNTLQIYGWRKNKTTANSVERVASSARHS